MAEFKRKSTNTFWHSPLALIVLFLILVIFSYNMVGLFKKERETVNTKSLVLDKVNRLEDREKTLNASIEKLKTEKGTEDVIREKYQVVRPGEKMLIIVDQDDTNNTTPDVPREHGFVNWFKNIFK
jgi:cell division protein FtsB